MEFLPALLGVVATKLYDFLASDVASGYKLTKEARANLEKLQINVNTIVRVQEDADDRQVSDRALLYWLEKIRDAVYDAEDVVDFAATEALRRMLRQRKNGADDVLVLDRTATEARNLWQRTKYAFVLIEDYCKFNPVLFNRRLGSKLKRVLGHLDFLAEGKKNFHLKESDPREALPIGYRERIVPYISDSEMIIGRDNNVQVIVNLLHRARQVDNGSDARARDLPSVEIVSIVGMAGVGKTTLAQLAFNNEEVVKNFSLRIWVCVSEIFDVYRVIRDIIQQIDHGKECESSDFVELRSLLTQKITGRKFLLVLDDVWNDSRDEWRMRENGNAGPWRILEGLLSKGAKTSKILVTTREDRVSSMMGSSEVHKLEVLLEEECWLLLKQRAFAGGKEEEPRLVEIGREIAKKCGGLPLAAKLLGGLLRGKPTEREWDIVMKSKIWEDTTDMLPALKLSYNHVPSKSRSCFAYCSIFPKDYELKKTVLIQHWIGNNFVQVDPNQEKELEDVGHEVFNDLLSRSLFHYPKKDEHGDVTTCKMHDLVHELAASIVKDECNIIWLNANRTRQLSNTIRHLSIVDPSLAPSCKIPKTFCSNAGTLRTLHLLSPIVIDKNVFLHLKFLRVLDLRRADIVKVPESINKLKHLRYLDFSNPKIQSLPETISELLNLQTLNLNRCNLRTLPRKTRNLVRLRHLDIGGCPLSHMPVGIEKLTCLQSLSDFIVAKNGEAASLSELQALNLGGVLSLEKLENCEDSKIASQTNLIRKKYLTSLRLHWSKNHGRVDDNTQDSANKVLDSLEPHPNIRVLKIENYTGKHLSTWMTDSSRYLVRIVLSYCSWCQQLPALGLLPKLKDLQVMGFHAAKKIDQTFYGPNKDGLFPSLEEFSLSDMPLFKEWSALDENGASPFPVLRRLTIGACLELEKIPKIPSLERVELHRCQQILLNNFSELPSISNLILFKIIGLKCLKQELFTNSPTSLRKLYIVDCTELESFSMDALQYLTSLQHLEIKGCENLVSLPNSMRHLRSLNYMEIRSCPKLQKVTMGLQDLATTLRSVKIIGCLSICDWSDAGLQMMCSVDEFQIQVCHKKSSTLRWMQKGVQSIRIHGKHGFNRFPIITGDISLLDICCCEDLEEFPWELESMCDLDDLSIRDCISLRTLPPKLGDLPSLRSLSIINCPRISKLPGKLTNVKFLLISNSSSLANRCRDHGQDWGLISHIPEISVN